MVTTRRRTYPRGTYRLRPRLNLKRKWAVSQVPRKRVTRRAPLLPRRGVKRSGSAMMSKAKRQRPYVDPNQYQQLHTLVSRRGRKTSAWKFIKKLATASYDFSKFIYRSYVLDTGVGTTDTGGRFNPCGLENPGTTRYYPMYLYNLTTLPQSVSGAYTNNPIGFRMYSDTATPVTIGWANTFGLNSTGASTSPSYWLPNVTDANTLTGPGMCYPKALMEYVNIKVTMRGPTKKPTRFVLMLVQPYAWFDALPENGTAGGTSLFNFWQEEANRLCANMCQNAPATGRKPWRVLGTKVFEIQPTSTTETDVGGHDVHQRWFWKCNRVLNYRDTRASANQDSDLDYSNLAIGSSERGKRISTYAAQGSQIYLYVKAYSPVGAGGFDATVHPSFDISIEKKVSSFLTPAAL